MTSETDICNRALAESGARSSIASLTENSTEAKAAAQFYQSVRDQVLRAARWGFARKTATLSLLKAAPGTPESTVAASSVWTSASPAPPWLYSYALPSDCMLFWRVQQQSNPIGSGGVPIFSVASLGNNWGGYNYDQAPIRFEMGSDDDASGNPVKVILANEPQALGVYGRRITDPTIWDELFSEAVVQALAGKFAFAVSGDKELTKMRLQLANAAIMAARAADSNQGLTVAEHDASWITARGSVAVGAQYGSFFAPYGPLFVA